MADEPGWLGGLAGAIPNQNSIIAKLLNSLGGVSPPAEPTAAPGVPTTPGVPNLSPFGPPPMTPTRVPIAPQGPTSISSPPSSWAPGQRMLPPAPQYGAPPQMASPEGADFSAAQSWMNKAAPQAPNVEGQGSANTANILGGLARGASEVKATEPGSFARALAMAGAGGSEARAKGLEGALNREEQFKERQSKYAETRAGQEINLAKAQHEFSLAKAQVDYQNAKTTFDTQFKNEQLQYEQNLKEMELKMPKVHNYSGGVGIETINPDGSVSMQMHDTRQAWEKLDSMGKTYQGLGLEPVYGQMAGILSMKDIPTPVKQQMITELGVKEIVDKNLGATAFGNVYKKVEKQVDAELKNDTVFQSMAVNPSGAQKAIEMRNRAISARLMSLFSNDPKGIPLDQIGKYSHAGAIMMGRNAPPETP